MISPFKSKVSVKEFKSLKGRVKYDVDDHDDGDHQFNDCVHIILMIQCIGLFEVEVA